MALIATQYMTAIGGTAFTRAAASAGGDTVGRPTPGLYLDVLNSSASSVTVTIAVPGNTWNGQPTPDTPVTVAAGQEKLIPVGSMYDDGTGVASITYSAVTSVTVAALQVL